MPARSLLPLLAAEALGTFVLVFAGTGAIAVDADTGGALGVGGVALAFGAAVGLMVIVVGPISGAHMNPAVTLALAGGDADGRRRMIPYWAAQIAGALAASGAVAGIFGRDGDLGVTRPTGVGDGAALAIEAGLTALLVVVIVMTVADPRIGRAAAAAAIGATIALEALVMGPVTGASMNPARSIGPALVSGETAGLWIYLAGPMAGALGGLGLCAALRSGPGSDTAEEA